MPAAAPPPSDRKPAILVVDDEEAMRDLMSRMLQRAGFEPVPAAGGREAREYFRQRHIDAGPALVDRESDIYAGRYSGTEPRNAAGR